MRGAELKVTYIGGPTALLESGGLRLLTDPTFDVAAEEYVTEPYTLRKLTDPVVAPESLGPVDAVLLSHDHHFDNLDRAGRGGCRQVCRKCYKRELAHAADTEGGADE
jgi:L-ascorbate metabolism protein UlaG (beta-lactamase superfamily)